MKNINWVDHLFNFLAVILGVSLAFYANNWATKEKENESLNFFIQAMYEELNEDIDIYRDYQIPDNTEKVTNLSKALELLNKQEENDSIDYLISSALQMNSYSPQNVAFNSILSSGKMDLIENLELRGMLLRYSLNSKEVEAQGEAQYEFLINRIIPWMIDNPGYYQGVDVKVDNTGFILILSIYLSINNNKLEKYGLVLEQVDTIVSFLEKEFDYLYPVKYDSLSGTK